MAPPNMTPTQHHSPPQSNLLMQPNGLQMPPNPQALTALHQQMMASPHHQAQLQNPMMSPMQKMQMLSPQQQHQLTGQGHGHQQENKLSPGQQTGEGRMQQSMNPISLHLSHMQQMAAQQQLAAQQPTPKSSPNFYPNGQNSPNFANNLFNQFKLRQAQILAEEQPLPLVTTAPPKTQQMPLQEIRNNQIEESGENHGAIDLTKKPGSLVSPLSATVAGPLTGHLKQSSPVVNVDAALKSLEELNDRERLEKDHRCSDPGNGQCVDCIHSEKLKTLRLNVVRMLSILVPNLNFEEKGISAEGDSVDELLHDVIESNIQEEVMSE